MVTDLSYHDEDTLAKVQAAITGQGIWGQPALDLINAMQNAGILFRERIPEDDDEAKDNRAVSEIATQAEEPIEHRLRRAFVNGWREGFDRGSWGDNRWDR